MPETMAAVRDDLNSDQQRIEAFGRAIDELRREVEKTVGAEDLAHIERITKISRRLEILGRSLIHVSLDPLTFGLGVTALSVHKALELMEIGHTALHGTYDTVEGAERFRSEGFYWKAPIDEASWHALHNVKHHQHTNVAGGDPDLDFGAVRLSSRVPYRAAFALQPVSNFFTWLAFASAINLHATGLLDVYLDHEGKAAVLRDRKPATIRAAHRAFLSKYVRYYGREYVFFPLLAGPFFWKTLLGNALSELARDVYAGATIYCGHVGATDYPVGTEAKTRAEWYVMQVEGARDFDVPLPISILSGALDRQIEHHLFPRLPPNRLRQISARVKKLCSEHGVTYRSDSWPKTLVHVAKTLRELASPNRAGTSAANVILA